ncbi:MAG: hypothetical protein ACE5Z5_01695 [Candidatus Bathyarchaeia archaeon]
MDKVLKARVAMVEAYPPESASKLGLEGKTYGFASNLLGKEGFELLYESRTGVLSPFQRELYEAFLKKVPEDLTRLVDPIVISFAVKDACDYSNVDYFWIDLEETEDVGNGAWVREKDRNHLLGLTVRFLESHLEKYVIDEYDRRTRENLTRAWEAQLKLPGCQICGANSLERGLIVIGGRKLRCWICPSCGHHMCLPSDVLDHLKRDRVVRGKRIR